MTVPRWLIPVLSVVAALAVAVAAAIVATQVTADPAAPSAVPAQVESVPVLQPIPVGADGLPLPDSDGDPETIDTSPSTGATEIVTPGTGDPADLGARTEARIDALDSSDGLDEPAARELVAAADEESAATPGDPCSPADGTSVDGCPDGLHGAIFALTEPEPLRVFPRADPPAEIEGSGGIVACPSVPEGEFSFGVATTVPSTVTLRYWPEDDPAAEQTVTIEGDPADDAAWDAEVERLGGYPSGFGLFQHCTSLPGLLPNTRYESSTIAIDVLDRISSPVPLGFDSRGAATRPPMTIVPLTASLVYVSVPTTEAGALPWLKAWVVPEGEPADCSAYDSHREVRRVAEERVVEVRSAWLEARNYEPAYNRRVTNVFSVPEGSSIVFCARWYDATAPSWSRDLPRDQVSAVVDSPDAYSPVVTVTSLALADAVDAGAIRLTASTPFGVDCGARVNLPFEAAGPGAPVLTDAVLCAPGRIEDGPGLGSGGNIVITSRVRAGDGTATNSSLLPLSRYGCLGDCPAPPTLTFAVLLPTVAIGTGLCGSSFGSSCTPPTTDMALGTATVTVTWEQGSTSGQREWQVGQSSYEVPDAPVRDYPQLDTFQVVRPQLSADGFEGTAIVPIRVDRPATYRATIAGDCFVGDAPAPLVGRTAFSSGGQGAELRIPHLCPGELYEVSVELTDDDGNRAAWGYDEPWPRTWYNARVTIPQNELTFAGTVEISNIAGTPRPWWTSGAIVQVGGPDAWEIGPEFPDDLCFARTELSTEGTYSGEVLQARVIHLSLRAYAITEGLYMGVNRDADCSWRDQTWNLVRLEADISYADFLRGGTFTGDLYPEGIADGRYGAEFQAVFTIRGSAP